MPLEHDVPRAPQTLMERLRPVADRLNALQSNLGLTPSRTFIRLFRYVGGRRGQGAMTLEEELELTPPPVIVGELHDDVPSGGRVRHGRMELRQISARYTEAQLDVLFGAIADDEVVFIDVERDRRHGSLGPTIRRFKPVGPPELHAESFEWRLPIQLEGTIRQRTQIVDAGAAIAVTVGLSADASVLLAAEASSTVDVTLQADGVVVAQGPTVVAPMGTTVALPVPVNSLPIGTLGLVQGLAPPIPTDAADPATSYGQVVLRDSAGNAVYAGLVMAMLTAGSTARDGAPVFLARADEEPNMGARGKLTTTPPAQGVVSCVGSVFDGSTFATTGRVLILLSQPTPVLVT